MYPDYLRVPPFDAIGVRDPESTQVEPLFGRKPFPYVPCASIMHSAFDVASHAAPRYEAVVYIQKDPLMPPLPGLATMSNATRAAYNSAGEGRPADRRVTPARSPARAIHFISQGKVVITNSYHGALWGQHLEKPVVVVGGWSTKFRKLPVQEAVCAVELADIENDMSGVLERATVLKAECADRFAGLLADSRERNIEFGRYVTRILQERGLIHG